MLVCFAHIHLSGFIKCWHEGLDCSRYLKVSQRTGREKENDGGEVSFEKMKREKLHSDLSLVITSRHLSLTHTWVMSEGRSKYKSTEASSRNLFFSVLWNVRGDNIIILLFWLVLKLQPNSSVHIFQMWLLASDFSCSTVHCTTSSQLQSCGLKHFG